MRGLRLSFRASVSNPRRPTVSPRNVPRRPIPTSCPAAEFSARRLIPADQVTASVLKYDAAGRLVRSPSGILILMVFRYCSAVSFRLLFPSLSRIRSVCFSLPIEPSRLPSLLRRPTSRRFQRKKTNITASGMAIESERRVPCISRFILRAACKCPVRKKESPGMIQHGDLK